MTPDTRAALPSPPAWACWLLSLLLPRTTAESVSGDLLEHYRETVLSARGAPAADAWFLRQVTGFLWRSIWMFAALTAAAIMLRTIADTFAPPDPGPAGYQLRSAMSTYSAIGTFLLAGLSAGYRTGRSVAGLLTAATAAAAGHALALCGDVVLFVAVIQHDPVKLGVFYQTGGWGEVFAFLIIMPVVAAVLGWLGGACGKVLTPSSSVSHVGM